MSLNPALDGVHLCPRCGAEADVTPPRSLICPACDYKAYYNPTPAAGAIPFDSAGRIWLMRRGTDPGRGLWTFPGGFVDLGESVPEAARREAREEMGVDLEIGTLVGVYSRADDRVLLVVYRASLADDARPATSEEATEVRAFGVGELPWGQLAFWSTERALRDVLI